MKTRKRRVDRVKSRKGGAAQTEEAGIPGMLKGLYRSIEHIESYEDRPKEGDEDSTTDDPVEQLGRILHEPILARSLSDPVSHLSRSVSRPLMRSASLPMALPVVSAKGFASTRLSPIVEELATKRPRSNTQTYELGPKAPTKEVQLGELHRRNSHTIRQEEQTIRQEEQTIRHEELLRSTRSERLKAIKLLEKEKEAAAALNEAEKKAKLKRLRSEKAQRAAQQSLHKTLKLPLKLRSSKAKSMKRSKSVLQSAEQASDQAVFSELDLSVAKETLSKASKKASRADKRATELEATLAEGLVYTELNEEDSDAEELVRWARFEEEKRQRAELFAQARSLAESDELGRRRREDTTLSVPCCMSSLDERLVQLELSIANMHATYLTLLEHIANDILGEYGGDESLANVLTTYPIEFDSYEGTTLTPEEIVGLKHWKQNIRELLFGFQRITLEDVKKAFFFLLYSFEPDPDKPGYIDLTVAPADRQSVHAIILNYSYKMATSLFTNANITAAVIMYHEPRVWSPTWRPPGPNTADPFLYLSHLLTLMRDGSDIVNQYVIQGWSHYRLPAEVDSVRYFHSGGNMIAVIAGMLCYLYDTFKQGHVTQYGEGILEDIRRLFHVSIGERLNEFYGWLTAQMKMIVFRDALFSCTQNISDLDFILMAPDKYVNTGLQNPLLLNLHYLSRYILRNILATVYAQPLVPRQKLTPYEQIARSLLPFHHRFQANWSDFASYKMPPLDDNLLPGAPADPNYGPQPNRDRTKGYRQTSSQILQVPMYLNRIKQGYAPYRTISQYTNIPANVRDIYATKYGECIDLSIGVLQNPLYQHKHENYKKGNYYTIDTILWELEQILLGPPDDKTSKREMRRNFLILIHTDLIDILFQSIGYFIQRV